MDDNTAEVLFFAALFGALALCYVASKVTDYLEHRPARCRCGCAEGQWDEVGS